jgi:hypothetical protein
MLFLYFLMLQKVVVGFLQMFLNEVGPFPRLIIYEVICYI